MIKLNRKRRTEEEEEQEEGEASAGSTRSLVPAGLRDLTAKKVQQSSRLEWLRLSRAAESNLCSLVLASPPTGCEVKGRNHFSLNVRNALAAHAQ